MSQSGATVSAECISTFNELKIGKNNKFIIYKLSDDLTEVVVDQTSADGDWEQFRTALLDAKVTIRGKETSSPRWAVYDLEYNLASGEGTRNKIVFLAWSPDDAAIKARMVYASSKESLKNSLVGIGMEIQANEPDELEESEIVRIASKGLAEVLSQ